jgi:hypothetical protein
VDPAPGVYRFHFTEPGWVFVRTLSGGPGVRATLDADPEPLFSYGENETDANETGAREAMCDVAAGDHAVTLEGCGSGDLQVRRVPEIRYCKFQYDPWVYHDGPYDWAFLEKYMLPHVNTIVGMHDKDQSRWAVPWRERGGRWIIETTAPGIERHSLDRSMRQIDADEVVAGLTGQPNFQQPWVDGQLVDEYYASLVFLFEPTVEAVRRVHADPDYQNKPIELYLAGSAEDLGGFFQEAVEAGCQVALERYNATQPTEPEARAYLHRQLVETMRGYCALYPEAARRMVIALGILSSPPETIDAHPQVNYRVFQDMEFHLLANDPVFENLAGIMAYTSGYAEKHTLRWVGRLYRHYCIEGNQSRLSDAPYLLGHLANGDFVDGTTGWQTEPADNDSIKVRTVAKLGRRQGRWGAGEAGNHCLVMTRSAVKPNIVRQEIKGLVPGKLYVLRLNSTNLVHRDGGYGNPAFDDVTTLSIGLDGAEIDNDKSFDQVYRSISTPGLMFFNYHVRRFRPTTSTVMLTLTDWASPKIRRGNVNRETAINFLQVCPCLEEE